MLLDLLLFSAGVAGLYFGAEWLVGGASRAAATFGVSTFVVGLTLVAFGTSAPELVVSALASYQGNPGLAVGNVLGSNIANIALILGISAVILPIAVQPDLLVRDVPVMIGSAMLIPVIAWSGVVGRWEGALLLILFAGYVMVIGMAAKRDSASVLALMEEQEASAAFKERVGRDLAIAAVGLVLLAGAAQLLVTSSTRIALAFGVPEFIIGLTLVAVGTSLPELAASVSAARRGDGQMVIGNIIGSNIFNILLILGVAALIRPMPVEPSVVWIDGPIVIALSLALVPLLFTQRRIDRWEGVVLIGCYGAFIAWTFL